MSDILGLSVQPDVTNTSAEVTRWTSADHVNRYNQAHMTSVRITHHSSTGLSYDTGKLCLFIILHPRI